MSPWRHGFRLPTIYAMVVVGSATVVLAGFLRESVIARTFGTSAAADGVVLSIALPQFLQTLLIGPIINGSGVRRLAQAGDRHHTVQVGFALMLGGLATTLPVLLVALLAPALLVHVLAPSAGGRVLATAGSLMPWVAGSSIALYSAAVLTALLNIRGHARFTTFAQALPALAIVASLLALHGLGTAAYGIGALAGAAILLLVSGQRLLAGVRDPVGLLELPDAGLIREELKRLVVPSAALMGAAALGQVLAVVERSVALGAQTGTLAAISYALRITSVPVVLSTGMLSSIIFVRLARASEADFGPYLMRVVGVLSLGITFVAALLFVNANLVVDVFLRRGAFDAHSAASTVLFLRLYCFAVPLQLLAPLLGYALYARGRATAVAAISAVTIVVNAVILIGLSPWLGPRAIPLAFLVVSVLSVLFQALALRHELGHASHKLRRMAAPALYVAVCAAACAVMVGPLGGVFARGLLGAVTSTLVLGGLGAPALLAAAPQRLASPADADA
ncbi:MAG TPA: lipid II flippase MurJ [Candidatus Dormibacteraeota bacterium]|nr:lipid II flippase MurJ [Candidatus Dormibacteraeota bacterium]